MVHLHTCYSPSGNDYLPSYFGTLFSSIFNSTLGVQQFHCILKLSPTSNLFYSIQFYAVPISASLGRAYKHTLGLQPRQATQNFESFNDTPSKISSYSEELELINAVANTFCNAG